MARPRLVERLRAAGQGQLSLIAAPAGFGKTTLVGEWLHRCEQPIAWLSLDAGDDEPVRFWTYVIAALQTHEAGIGRGTLSLLQTPPTPTIESILTTLLNDLLDCPPVVLVLDDYHVITNSAIHKAIDFLLDHLPPTLHLVMTSRSRPPLALARLRARRLLNDTILARPICASRRKRLPNSLPTLPISI